MIGVPAFMPDVLVSGLSSFTSGAHRCAGCEVFPRGRCHVWCVMEGRSSLPRHSTAVPSSGHILRGCSADSVLRCLPEASRLWRLFLIT